MLNQLKSIVLFAALCAAGSSAAARETSAPDILLFIADDLGTQIGCYGDPYVKTPHIDALAGEGTRFENAWVTQASCSPSRGSIMTGLYPHQTGLTGLAHRGFSMDRRYPMLPSLLKQAGYYTGVVGKVHIAPAPEFDFAVTQGSKEFNDRDPEDYAREVARFLNEADVQHKPVFLNVSFVDPHRQFPGQVNGYPARPLTETQVKPLSFLPGLEGSSDVRKDTADYYNCVMRVDAGVELVMDELKRAGRLQNTIVVFIGDHGAPFSRGKASSYHSGINVPFIIRWPGVSTPGLSTKALVSTVDILPTLLDAAGTPMPPVAGKSLRKLLENPEAAVREYLVSEYTAHLPQNYYPRRTIRNARYQLIHNLLHDRENPESGIDRDSAWTAVMKNGEGTSQTRELLERLDNPPQYELYDLQEDPASLRNLAADPAMADVKQRLLNQLETWQEQTSDTLRTREDVLAYERYIKAEIYPGNQENKTGGSNSKGRRDSLAYP